MQPTDPWIEAASAFAMVAAVGLVFFMVALATARFRSPRR